MLITSKNLKNKLLNNCIHREIIIRFPDDDIADITGSNIVEDSFELTQSLFEGSEFKLGGGVASQLVVQVIDIENELNNKRINVFLSCTYLSDILYPSETLYPRSTLYSGRSENNYEIQLFSGTIDSSLRQRNRQIKEIIAYDDLYRMSNIQCKDNFTGYVQYTMTKSDVTLSEFRDYLIERFELAIDRGINKTYLTDLNIDTVLKTTLETATEAANDKITLLDLLRSCYELNSSFLVCGNDGTFKAVKLYQRSGENYENKKVDVAEIIPSYQDLEFEEYITRPINRIRFEYNKNKKFDYGYSTGKESWYLSDNELTKCLTGADELVNNFFQRTEQGVVHNYIFYDLYSYRPFSATLFDYWWLEPGDRVQIQTGYTDTEIVDSFIFSKKIKGINGMSVTIKAGGVEYLGKDEITDGSELSTNKLG